MAFTGAAERVGTATNFGIRNENFGGPLAWDGTNLYMFASQTIRLYTLNRETGRATSVATPNINGTPITTSPSFQGACFHNGVLYVSGFDGPLVRNLYSADKSNARLTLIGSFGSGISAMRSLLSDGTTLYGIDFFNEELWTINTTTGTATKIEGTNFSVIVGASLIAEGATFHNGVMYMVNRNELYSFDIPTKTVTRIGDSTFFGINHNIGGMASDGTEMFGQAYSRGSRSSRTAALVKFVQTADPAPTLSTPFPTSENVDEGQSYTYNLASHFSGSPTSYSIGTISPASPTLTATVSDAGALSITAAPEVSQNTTYTIPITATNAGGSITENFSLRVNHIPPVVIPRPTLSSPLPTNVSIDEGESYSRNLATFFTGNPAFSLGTITPSSPRLRATITSAGVLSIPTLPEVDRDTEYMIPVIATNAGGSLTTNFAFTVSNVVEPPVPPTPVQPVDPLHEFAFRDLPAIYQVSIAGIDVSDIVDDISGLSQQLDIVTPTTFTTADVNIILNDEAGNWNPEKQSNRFTQNDQHQTGFDAPVSIQAGFIDSNGTEQLQDIFVGKILSVHENAGTHQMRIRVTDDSQRLRKENITNFGIQKQLVLEEGSGRSVNASYPFPEVLAPVSEGSLVADGLTEKERLEIEGDLDPTNVKLTPNALETEGGPLDTDPDVMIKSPYRWRRIDKAVADILAHYDLQNSQIQIDEQDFDENYMSTYGRPGYFLEGDKSETWRWRGNITDIIHAGNNIFYMLYSSRNDSTLPRIVEYNRTTDEWTTVYQHTEHAEFWKMVIDGNNIYIIGTKQSGHLRAHILGSYNPSEINPATTIWNYNLSPNTLSEYVPADNALPVALGYYYHFGFLTGTIDRIGIQPDNRKGFVVYNGELYYPYVQRTGTHGVAKATAQNTTEVVISAPKDGTFTSINSTFYIDGNKLYFGFASMGSDRSSWKIEEITLT